MSGTISYDSFSGGTALCLARIWSPLAFDRTVVTTVCLPVGTQYSCRPWGRGACIPSLQKRVKNVGGDESAATCSWLVSIGGAAAHPVVRGCIPSYLLREPSPW